MTRSIASARTAARLPQPSATVHPPARRWATVGALVASATLGGRLSVPLAAAEPGEASPFRGPSAGAIVLQVERSLARWPRPEDVLEAVFRVAATPAAAPRAGGDRVQPLLTASPQEPPVFRFDIPPGPLGAALQQFQRLTGVAVRAPADLLRDLTTSGVAGLLTADQALRVLLADSRLSFRFTSAAAVTIEVERREERVTVVDTLPAVSSPKFPEPLLDTPQTITVVDRHVIESQGATTLRDILRNVPGITMQAGEGGGGLPGDSLTMRGFSATNDIFIDGVRDVGPYSRDAFNLEQVEVIKGPTSTFGGRGSTGGAINLQTKVPQMQSRWSGAISGGGADFRRTTIDVNQPLGRTGAHTAARLNVMWQDAGVPGRNVVENRSWAVAPSLGLGVGTTSRLTLSYQHLEQDNVPDYGLPWGASTDPVTGEVFPTGAFHADPAVDQRNFYGLADYDFERVDNDVATVRAEHDFRGGVTLRHIARYGETGRDHAITAPRPPNRQLQRRWMHNATLANQTSLSARVSTGRITHDLSAGLEFAREDTKTENSAQTTNQPSISVRTPDPTQAPFGPMPPIAGNPAATRTATAGAYLFDTVGLSPKVQLSGGLRWDRSAVDYSLTTRATGEVTELDRVDRMLSGRAGIVFKPTPAGSIYLGYGTSFNPASDAGNVGAALSANENAANNVNLEPEKSRNVEAGIKWAVFDQRLQVSGTAFDTEKTNARTRAINSDPYVLAGRQRVRGVELGASGEIRPGWTALASFSLMNSEIVDSANTAEAGRDLALTPANTASLWSTWQVNRRLSVGGGAQFMDAVFRNTTAALEVPSYWLANAMASYGINSHLTLRINGTNLGNTSYVDRVGGGHYVPGPGRTVQATVNVEY